MKSKLLAILALASMILTLCSCASNDIANGDISPVEDSVNSALTSVPSYIDKTIHDEDVEVVIAATVSIPNVDSIEEVILTYEDAYTEKMVNSLMYDIYEDVEHPSSYSWIVYRDNESARCVLNMEPQFLTLSYTNADADYSGNYYDYEHMLDYGFFTQHNASGNSDFGVDDAINTVKVYFEDYSDLSFEPYRVLAAATEENGGGYYTVWLQGEYDGISICPRLSDSGSGLGVTAWVNTDNEIYSFQGRFALNATKHEPIESLVSFDSVFDLFCSNVSLFVSGSLEISNVKLEYFADRVDSNSYSLRPVWSFYGVTNGNGSSMDWVFCYYADNCEFCYAGPLFY